MFKVNDYVVYKRDVCKVKEIKKNYRNNTDYYILVPIDDNSLTIQVPIDNKNYLRNLLTKEQVEKIIDEIHSIQLIQCDNKVIESEYKNLLYSDNHIDLIKIIKTTYLRNKARIDNNKKVGDKDNYYFEKAEKYLYNEFSIVLGLNIEETRKYIINKLNNIK